MGQEGGLIASHQKDVILNRVSGAPCQRQSNGLPACLAMVAHEQACFTSGSFAASNFDVRALRRPVISGPYPLPTGCRPPVMETGRPDWQNMKMGADRQDRASETAENHVEGPPYLIVGSGKISDWLPPEQPGGNGRHLGGVQSVVLAVNLEHWFEAPDYLRAG